MAYNINQTFKNDLTYSSKIYIFFRINKIEILIRKIIVTLNNKFKKKSNSRSEKIYQNIINTNNLLKYKKELEEKNYAYVENFFTDEFYSYLIKNWPKNYLFRPPFGLDKFYDTGFIFKKNEKLILGEKHLDWLEDLYKYLGSKDFKVTLKEFSDFDLYFESSGLNQTRTGSYIALHLDDVEKDESLYGSLNCIIIVDSSETNSCANLSLGKSNNWNDIYFKSPNLKNSALIYKIGAYHYHGFTPVKKNEFRKAINVRFLREDQNNI